MIMKDLPVRILLLLACFRLALPLALADSATPQIVPNCRPQAQTERAGHARRWAPVHNQPQIAKLTAQMLERNHYSRQPFDDSVSSKFLDRYLNTFDPQ